MILCYAKMTIMTLQFVHISGMYATAVKGLYTNRPHPHVMVSHNLRVPNVHNHPVT